MKGVALGLCQWKDEHLWYQGKIWIPNNEGLKTSLIRKCHDDPLAGHGGTAKTTELVSRQYLAARDARNNQTICQKLRHVPTEQSGPTCTIWNAPIKRGPRPTMEINRYGLHHRLTKFRQIRHNTRCYRSPDENEPFYSM